MSGWAAEEGTSEIREKTECWENKAKQICKHSSAWLQQQQHTALLPRAGRAWWTELWTRTHNHWIHFPAQLVTFPFLNICASASPPAEMDMETLISFVEFTNVILKRRLLLLPSRRKIGNVGRDLAGNYILFCKTTSCQIQVISQSGFFHLSTSLI